MANTEIFDGTILTENGNGQYESEINEKKLEMVMILLQCIFPIDLPESLQDSMPMCTRN